MHVHVCIPVVYDNIEVVTSTERGGRGGVLGSSSSLDKYVCDMYLHNVVFFACSVMYSGINSVPPLDPVTPVGSQPYASPQAATYFIIYMTIMTFVLLQLFIGVVIVAFQEVGVKSFRETKLDRNQVRLLKYMVIIFVCSEINENWMFQKFLLRSFTYTNCTLLWVSCTYM